MFLNILLNAQEPVPRTKNCLVQNASCAKVEKFALKLILEIL